MAVEYNSVARRRFDDDQRRLTRGQTSPVRRRHLDDGAYGRVQRIRFPDRVRPRLFRTGLQGATVIACAKSTRSTEQTG